MYWKVKNVVQVKRSWRVEYGTPPPRVTITRIRDKFEVDGQVHGLVDGSLYVERGYYGLTLKLLAIVKALKTKITMHVAQYYVTFSIIL